MLKNTKKTIGLILKNFSFLLILFALFLNNDLKAQENEKKFIGFIDALEGSVSKGNADNLVELKEFDQIFENEKIIISPNSSVVISFIDNSVLTLENDSEFLVEKFDKISEEPSFIMNISKGKFVFESGTIAKDDKGVMKIKLSDAEVDLQGTCITGAVTDDSTSVALVADSMGNVGTFDITIDGQTTSAVSYTHLRAHET